MTQFSIRTLLIGTLLFCIYLSLVPFYGMGRAIVCLLTILLGLSSSSLFFAAAYHSASEKHSRNALATGVLGAMILGGSFFIAAIVFQRPPPTSFELPEETERSRNEVLGTRYCVLGTGYWVLGTRC